MADGVLLSCRFMLREIEFGGLRRSHLHLSGGKVHLCCPCRRLKLKGHFVHGP